MTKKEAGYIDVSADVARNINCHHTEYNPRSRFSIDIHHPYGTRVPMRIDVKKYLEGKVSPESDTLLQAGDLVVAQGNARKTLGTIGETAGPGSFTTIIARGW